MRKWLVLGILIGVVAGLGALAFYGALELGTRALLGGIAGYHPATTTGEGGGAAATGPSRPWLLPLLVAAGGLVSGLLVFLLAPEAEGHGTDAAIAAIHHHPRGMRGRVAAVKIVASAVTIGSGGSGGREGPAAQISATFGSMISRWLNLSPSDTRIAVSTGLASGIGAIFRAPLGGAVLAAELPYRDDVEVEALFPAFVASIVAFAVFASVAGFTPIFGYHPEFRFDRVGDLPWFALLGVVAGGLGRLYSGVFYGGASLFSRWPAPKWVKPAVAGAAVGLLGLAVPSVLGTGYGAVQHAMDPAALAAVPLWLVLVLPFAKIVATTLSIGSGGSGGIFGPGMVIGGASGAALFRVVHDLAPSAVHAPGPFVIVGMIACFGAVAHAPLSVMLMVAEMTGNLSLLAPAIVAVAFATLVVGDTTIYRSQLRTRAESPAHRLTLGLPLAHAVPVRDVMQPPRVVLDAALPLPDARRVLADAEVPGAPVRDEQGGYIGAVQTSELGAVDASRAGDPVASFADPTALTVAADATLDVVVDALATSREGWVAVLDADEHVVGVVGLTDLVRGYRLALRHSIRRLGRVSGELVLVESRVQAGSPAVGQAVRDLGLPRHTVIVAIQRGGNVVFADADTTIRLDDVVSVLTRPAFREAVVARFS